jgi:hypothetical protein
LFGLTRPVILASVAVGVLLGAALFLLFIAGASTRLRLDGLNASLEGLPEPAGRHETANGLITRLAARPLFTLATGPNAAQDVAVTLTGVAISRQGSSGLVAIGGDAPQWLALGATRNGVTMVEVHAAKIVVDTPAGLKEVRLWEKPAGGDQSSAASHGTTGGAAALSATQAHASSP